MIGLTKCWDCGHLVRIADYFNTGCYLCAEKKEDKLKKLKRPALLAKAEKWQKDETNRKLKKFARMGEDILIREYLESQGMIKKPEPPAMRLKKEGEESGTEEKTYSLLMTVKDRCSNFLRLGHFFVGILK